MTLWLVRGGKYGEMEALALRDGVALIGWDALGSLVDVRDRADLGSRLLAAYPDEGARTRSNWESQIWPFLTLFKPGDPVVMPLKSRPSVALGTVTDGGYAYREDYPSDMRHARAVTWRDELPRAAFDQDLLYSFGAFMTVCSIHRNDAERRIAAIMAGGQTQSTAAAATMIEPSLSVEPLGDLEQVARDDIRKLIARRFTGHDLTALVAALLHAQGYVVRQSPEGPDGGIDIVAGRGPLGFDAPRLAVQVKSGDSPSDIRMVRELQGVMRKFGADHGLFVSWAGFRGTVDRETARDFFGIRLWSSDDVIAALEENYERLPPAIQADLPLKRIWAVVREG